MAITSQAIVDSMLASIQASKRTDQPYKHWFLTKCLPQDVTDNILSLPFRAPDLGGISGKRELHNNTRTYFDQGNMDSYPVCKAFNDAFQSESLTKPIEQHFGTNLAGSFLRVEFAQDIDGFWLEPHTDLGVKVFTMLLYMSTDEQHKDLGTDIYDTGQEAHRTIAVPVERGHGVRAVGHHLPRLRRPQDRRRAQVGDHQLRHQRLARPRTACVP